VAVRQGRHRRAGLTLSTTSTPLVSVFVSGDQQAACGVRPDKVARGRGDMTKLMDARVADGAQRRALPQPSKRSPNSGYCYYFAVFAGTGSRLGRELLHVHRFVLVDRSAPFHGLRGSCTLPPWTMKHSPEIVQPAVAR